MRTQFQKRLQTVVKWESLQQLQIPTLSIAESFQVYCTPFPFSPILYPFFFPPSCSWRSPEGQEYFVTYMADEDGFRIMDSNAVPESAAGVKADGTQGSFAATTNPTQGATNATQGTTHGSPTPTPNATRKTVAATPAAAAVAKGSPAATPTSTQGPTATPPASAQGPVAATPANTHESPGATPQTTQKSLTATPVNILRAFSATPSGTQGSIKVFPSRTPGTFVANPNVNQQHLQLLRDHSDEQDDFRRLTLFIN